MAPRPAVHDVERPADEPTRRCRWRRPPRVASLRPLAAPVKSCSSPAERAPPFMRQVFDDVDVAIHADVADLLVRVLHHPIRGITQLRICCRTDLLLRRRSDELRRFSFILSRALSAPHHESLLRYAIVARHDTTSPLGRRVMRIAEPVTLTCWPLAPLTGRYDVMFCLR